MHSDVITNAAGNSWFSIAGLILFVIAFALIVIWVIRMDRKEVDEMSRLPLDSAPAGVNGDTINE